VLLMTRRVVLLVAGRSASRCGPGSKLLVVVDLEGELDLPEQPLPVPVIDPDVDSDGSAAPAHDLNLSLRTGRFCRRH
jgi:hypothetical protein